MLTKFLIIKKCLKSEPSQFTTNLQKVQKTLQKALQLKKVSNIMKAYKTFYSCGFTGEKCFVNL